MIGAPDVEASLLLTEANAAATAGDLTRSEALIYQALQKDPGDPDLIAALAMLAFRNRRSRDAVDLIQRALKDDPSEAGYHFVHALASGAGGDLDASIASFRRALARKPDFYQAWVNLIFSLDVHPSTTWQQALAIRRDFEAVFCQPSLALARPFANTLDPVRTLRVGYVGADFRGHSAATAFAPVIAHASRRILPFLYDVGSNGTPSAVDEFKEMGFYRDTSAMDGRRRAECIRRDKIDVLVDLAGYSAGGALTTFAHRAAPVQIMAWGYLTGSGLQCMDYLLSDEITIPRGHGERYTEDIVHLPAALAYTLTGTESGELLDTGPTPEAKNGYRTYGYLGRPLKLNPAVFDAWAAILHRRSDARLLLKSDQYLERELSHRVVNALVARGVDDERIEIRGATNRLDHLLAYRDVDVGLDSFPQTSGTTAGDCLAMGVPLVTLAGERVSERLGASMAHHAGRDEDVVTTRADYVERAVSIEVSSAQRTTIQETFEQSIVCDGPRYAGAVERAYRLCWQRYVERQMQEGAA